MTGLLGNNYSTETVQPQPLTLALNGENIPLNLVSAVHCAVFSWPLDWAGLGDQVVILRGVFMLSLANHLTPCPWEQFPVEWRAETTIIMSQACFTTQWGLVFLHVSL